LARVPNIFNNNNDNDIIKINHFTFTKKIKLSSVVTALLISMLLISTSAISMPSYVYGQTTTTTKKNTLKVITQVVCPPPPAPPAQGWTCPSVSDFTMKFRNTQDPKPPSFDGNSAGVDVTLGDGNYDVDFSFPNIPQGLVLYPRLSSNCKGTITGGQSITCTVLMAYATNADADQDGIPDSWETNGIPYMDANNVQQLYKLPGANPNHKDIYVEVDYMQDHKPYDAAIANVIKVFGTAPVTNPVPPQPDTPKQGINLHIQLDDQMPHQDTINFDDFILKDKPKWFGTDAERKDSNHDAMLAAKSIVYRYALFAHNHSPNSLMGTARGADFLVSLGNYAADPTTKHKVGSLNDQQTTFMHELGHTLGLKHGGGDYVNCKPNYYSVMNYAVDLYVADSQLDYSRSALNTLDKTNLDEPTGLIQSVPSSLQSPFGPPKAGEKAPFAKAGGAVDWNQNGETTDKGVEADINGGLHNDCPQSANLQTDKILNGFNDWSNIHYLTVEKYSGPQQSRTSQQQTLPIEKEPGIDDVRQARLILLQGVNNAVAQIKSGQTTGQANPIKDTVFEIQNLIGVLKKQGFSPPSPTAGAAATTGTGTIAATTSPGLTGVPGTTTTSSTLAPEVVALMQKPTGGMSVDMNNVAQLLKTDELGNAIGQLDKLLAEVSTLASSQSQQQQQPQQQQQVPPPSSTSTSPSTSQTPIANAGVSQTVEANATVMLDARNSQPAKPGTTITAYQWTQLPTQGAVPVNLIGGPNIPTPMFIAPTLPYDTTLSFGLRVLASDGSISTNDAVVQVMVKRYTGPTTTAGGAPLGAFQQQQQPPSQLQQPQQPTPTPQQQLPDMGQQQLPLSPNLQQQPNLPSHISP
jgi:hypothetical protein